MAIYLLGDAILDNFFWLENKELDLMKEISNLNYKVYNYAIDETKVADMINGIVPNKTYVTSRSYKYQITKNDKIYPLQELSKKINVNKSFKSVYEDVGIRPIGLKNEDDNMVVISIGGNNINENFINILLGIDYFMDSIITKEFIKDYERIIETVKSSCKKILLISMYLPYLGPNSSYEMYSGYATSIMNKWHDFLHKIARKYNIPVLDLNKTFNSDNRGHYGTIDTRPSNISSKCMAACIAHVYKNYDGYHVYYAPNCNSKKIIVN